MTVDRTAGHTLVTDWVTISAARRQPIEALTVPRGDGVVFVQIGMLGGLHFAGEGPDDVSFLQAQPPAGTVTIRW